MNATKRFGHLVGHLLVVANFLAVCPRLDADQLISLRSGVTLRGNIIEVATMDQNAFAAAADGGVQIRPIWMVDDGLRRTYIHRRGMVTAEPRPVPELGQRIEFFQPVPEGGEDVSSIGQVLAVSEFDDYGRRVLTVRGPDGNPFGLIQGITELTARYTKLESLVTDRPIRLDMRVATSTIDSESLRRVFRRRLDQSNVDERLEVVRFFIETERYADAHTELQKILRDFPEQDELRPQLTALVERQAMQLLEQAELRRASGQPQLAEVILRKFPLDRVSQITRLRVSDALGEIDRVAKQSAELVTLLEQLVGQLKPVEAAPVQSLVREIKENLNEATLPRLSDFSRLGNVDTLPIANRVALAITGWLLGSGSGEINLKTATSLIEVRDLVRRILNIDDPGQRANLIDQLSRVEGASAEAITKMLPLLRPPLDRTTEEIAAETASDDVPPARLPKSLPRGTVAHPAIAGMYQLGPDQAAFDQAQRDDPGAPTPTSLWVQLPPEYDPHRAYPCIVALHACGASPETQLNFWAGIPTDRFLRRPSPSPPIAAPGNDAENGPADATTAPQSTRLGHAMRHGFIVVTPRWTRPGQRTYEYTPREHAAVLRSLRAAMRRFSIDSDRVFLSGHGGGGTAAWDIAISHPDLWAGMIAIGADPEKTLLHYNKNASYIPTYLVMGEKDDRPLKRYGAIYDDYMSYQHDAMVVLYRGQGREFFHEECDRFFEWMESSSHKRRPSPEKIEVASMRRGDQFFWWLEWSETLPDAAIDPILWNDAPRIKAAEVSASIGPTNDIRIAQAPAQAFTVWLGPHLKVNMTQRVNVLYRSRRVDWMFDGSLGVLLEDVHARGDRKRPYWGRVAIP